MSQSVDHTRRPEGAGEIVLRAVEMTRTFRVGSKLSPALVSAVDGVSLQLSAGESLGIVGETGCGKSTLARMLVGLERPDSGTLTYRGQDVSRGRRADRRVLRRGVQMIFQDPYSSLDPRMTVLDLVAEPLAATRAMNATRRKARVAELLELVGLSAEMMTRYPHQFSGGQRQRIGIARALVLEPQVLVCDEPVSALDLSVQAQVINLLRDLQHRLGVALLFIAHDLSVVRHVADRTAVMYLGRLGESGRTADVYDAPRHPYTQALLSASPSVGSATRGRLRRRLILAGEPPPPVNPPSGCRFHERCPLAQDRCTTEIPVLRYVEHDDARDRLSACHFAEQVPAGTG